MTLAQVGFWPDTRAKWAALLIVLLVALVFRTAGLAWGVSADFPHPSPLHDEGHVVGKLRERDFFQAYEDYELFHGVNFWRLQAAIPFAIGDRLGLRGEQSSLFDHLVLRGITSLWALVGVVGVYLLRTRLGGFSAGLLAAALLAGMPHHAYLSQLIKEQAVTTTFLTLAALGCLGIWHRGSRAWYAWSGASLGLGVAVSPAGALALPFIGLTHAARAWRLGQWRSFVNDRLGWLGGAAGLSFLLVYPYPLLTPGKFWRLVQHPDRSVQASPNLDLWLGHWLTLWRTYQNPEHPYLSIAFGEPLAYLLPAALLAFAALTAILAFQRSPQAVDHALVLGLGLLAFHSLSFNGQLAPRYAALLSPFLAVGVARLLTALAALPQVGWAVPAVGFVLAGWTALYHLPQLAAMSLSDPRRQAAEWLYQNVPVRASVGLLSPWDRQSLPVDPSRLPVIPLNYPSNEQQLVRLHLPELVALHRLPSYEDSDFKVVLGPGAYRALEARLDRYYRPVQTVGAVPTVLGRRVPRTLPTDIVDVYRQISEPELETRSWLDSEAEWEMRTQGQAHEQEASRVVEVGPASWRLGVLSEPWRVEEHQEERLEVHFRFGPQDSEYDGTLALGLILLFGQGPLDALPDGFGDGPPGPALLRYRLENGQLWLYAWLRPGGDLLRPDELRLTVVPHSGRWLDLYFHTGQGYRLFEVLELPQDRFRLGYAVVRPDGSSAVRVRVAEVNSGHLADPVVPTNGE